jgi:hypothetical protein
MSRKCTICIHPQCSEIDRMLVEGDSTLREIADRFVVSRSSVARHKNNHLPAHLVRAREVRQVIDADDLLERLRVLQRETGAILWEARRAEDSALALRVIARAEKQIELKARLLGELQDTQQTINVLVLPQWEKMRATILHALLPYPAARAAVAEALQKMGDDEPQLGS